jgi:hypothetical protein
VERYHDGRWCVKFIVFIARVSLRRQPPCFRSLFIVIVALAYVDTRTLDARLLFPTPNPEPSPSQDMHIAHGHALPTRSPIISFSLSEPDLAHQ